MLLLNDNKLDISDSQYYQTIKILTDAGILRTLSFNDLDQHEMDCQLKLTSS